MKPSQCQIGPGMFRNMAHCQLEYNKLQKVHRQTVEALKALQQGFQDGSITWAKPRQTDSDPYHPANTLMCNALALAKQQS